MKNRNSFGPNDPECGGSCSPGGSPCDGDCDG